jgi:methoxymalonate biosynthesis acyl carrier protein
MNTQDGHRIKEAVREFILSSIRVPDLGDDDNLFESGIVNSLFAVQLMTFIERTFGIDVVTEDLDVENFKSLNATTAFVMRKYGGNGRCDPAGPGHVLDARTAD